MIFRSCRNLTGLQHLAIFFTTFVSPVTFDLLDGWFVTGLCLSCVSSERLAVYVGMWLFAMVVIALASRTAETRLEKKLNRMTSSLNDSVDELREESDEKIVGVQDRLDSLDSLVGSLRQTLVEELGIGIHHRVAARGAKYNFDVPELSDTHTPAVPPNKTARVFQWVRCRMLRLWRWCYRFFIDDR